MENETGVIETVTENEIGVIETENETVMVSETAMERERYRDEPRMPIKEEEGEINEDGRGDYDRERVDSKERLRDYERVRDYEIKDERERYEENAPTNGYEGM